MRILVVEDEARLRDQLQAALEEAARLCEAYDAAAERRRKAEEEAAALEAASSKEPPRQHWSLQMHR